MGLDALLTLLQLGGKDPAYVREDADLDYTVPELVEGGLHLCNSSPNLPSPKGAFFNSGQSCCAIEVCEPYNLSA